MPTGPVMRARLLLPLALAATVALAGCLGAADDLVDDEDLSVGTSDADLPTDDADETTSSVGHPATAYRLADANATASVDPGAALPGDVPLPAGLGRTVPGPLFEPTIGVTSDGAIFVSNTGKGELSEESPPPDTKYSSILRSTDGGATWTDATGSIGPVSIPPETGDPYVYVDPATDRVYNLDMIGLNCNWVRWSDDLGESWTSNPAGCGQPPVQDHPTIWAGPPTTLQPQGYDRVLYLCVNRIADSACSISLDGGLTWSPWRTISPGAKSNGDFCGGLHAHGTSGPEGTAYLPKGQCGTPTIYVTHDNGMTWNAHTISEEVPTDGHEVAIATDDQGTVYAFWISEDLQPYLSYSTDKGKTWSTPVEVSPPSVPVTSHPTIAAGSNGSVAMAYVGTEATAEGYQDVPKNATWNGYITTIVDATAEDPVVTTTTANAEENPIARGVCGGTRCRADDDAGIGDFIDITIDDEGRPWAAFVDVCLEKCEETGESVRKEGKGLVGTLARGPSLRGPVDALPSLPAPAAR